MHSKFHKIDQFRQLIESIKYMAQFSGLDENDQPIFDENAVLPTLPLRGTTKLHGTNAGLYYDDGNIKCQSRSKIVNTGHYDFVQFVSDNKPKIKTILKQVADTLNKKSFYVFGEWAGQGIQSGVAISQLEKAFYVFAVKYKDENGDGIYVDFSDPKWRKVFSGHEDNRIYDIESFTNWSISVDFNNPEKASDIITKLVDEVEKRCPVAARLGKYGCGEGIVWTTFYKNKMLSCKTKGEKHAVSKRKNKTKVEICPEELAAVSDFIEYAVTDNRYSQGLKEVFGEHPIQSKKFGELLKWITNDVLEEESDVISKNKLNISLVKTKICEEMRKRFFRKPI